MTFDLKKLTGLQKVNLQKEQAQTMPVAEASHLHFAQEPSIHKNKETVMVHLQITTYKGLRSENPYINVG